LDTGTSIVFSFEPRRLMSLLALRGM